MIYEILDDSGEVVNTIVADLAFVQANFPGRYREVPQPPPVDTRPPVITKVAFRFRLTDQEYVGILAAAKTEIAVQAWVETFAMVTQINLADARTIAGVQQLAALDLLTDERAATILTAPVVEEERP
jgi:hypothetical protein